ncbi:Glycosyl transferase group 1 [Burkholderia multivorans]
MKSNVLFIDQSGQLGGAELSLLDIAKRWQGDRKVFLFEDGDFRHRLEDAQVPVQVLADVGNLFSARRDSGVLQLMQVVPSMYAMVRNLGTQARNFDVLYANSQKAFVIGAIVAAVTRKRCVWHLRDMLTADHFSPLLRRVATLLANRIAAVVIANSQATADAFVSAGGKRNKVRVVHNGFDLSTFARTDAGGSNDLRRALACGEAPLVGVFSRLASWKGQHVVLDALRDLPGVHVVFVGAALFGEEKYEEYLRQRVGELKLTERVHFLGFRSDVPELLRAIDIAIHASTSPEPFGRVVVEAMLAGKPVIASAAGGVRELIDDGVTGILVPPGDAAALRGAIKRLIDDRPLADRLADSAAIHARQNFSVDEMLTRISKIVNDVR